MHARRTVSSRPTEQRDDLAGTPGPETPFAMGGGTSLAAFQLITRAEAMGLIDLADADANRWTTSLLDAALAGFARVGIGRRVENLTSTHGDDLRLVLEQLNHDVEHTPVPESEWRALVDVLGLDLLATLTGVSASSARRYLTGSRATPDDVADRLHFIALLVADLRGSYNEYGVRGWFRRARQALGGASPGEVLARGWTPDDHEAQRVAALARGLVTMSVT